MKERIRLPTQLHIGVQPRPFCRLPVPSREGYRGGFGKPPGALWTSTLETAHTDGWLSWLGGEGYKLGWPGTPDVNAAGWMLEPDECDVWVIRHGGDVEEFHRLYGRVPEWRRKMQDEVFGGSDTELELLRRIGGDDHEERMNKMFLEVDWAKVQEDVDAVWLMNAWGWNIRHGDYITFSGWDAESTAWLRWRFRGVAVQMHPPLLDKLFNKAALRYVAFDDEEEDDGG